MGKFTLNLDGPLLKIPGDVKQASFDYVGRYQLIAEIATRYFAGSKKPRNILDVGGLGSILDKITDIPLTILDSEAEDGQAQTQGDGANMSSIKDGAYDVVVTSDTLEHIPPRDRKNFIKELVRVSDDLVVLAAPFGDHGAAEEERRLQTFYKGILGEEHRWLREHEEYGLPKEKETMKYFEDTGASVITVQHSSIDFWCDLLMINLLANSMGSMAVHNASARLNTYYNEHILFKDFTKRSYRTFFVASKKRKLDYRQPENVLTSKEYVEIIRLISDFYGVVTREGKRLPKMQKVVNKSAEYRRKTILLQGDLDWLRTEHENMINSKSWKITKPLRKMKHPKPQQ